MWRLVSCVVLAIGSTAWGAQTGDTGGDTGEEWPPTYDQATLVAIEVGDFDGSGALDQALAYSNVDGEVLVEIAFDVPENDLLKAQSSTREDVVMAVSDLDGDGCDDLLLTALGRDVALTSGDLAWIPDGARDTGGDADGDMAVYICHGPDGHPALCRVDRTCVTKCDATTTIGKFEVCTEWHVECTSEIVVFSY